MIRFSNPSLIIYKVCSISFIRYGLIRSRSGKATETSNKDDKNSSKTGEGEENEQPSMATVNSMQKAHKNIGKDEETQGDGCCLQCACMAQYILEWYLQVFQMLQAHLESQITWLLVLELTQYTFNPKGFWRSVWSKLPPKALKVLSWSLITIMNDAYECQEFSKVPLGELDKGINLFLHADLLLEFVRMMRFSNPSLIMYKVCSISFIRYGLIRSWSGKAMETSKLIKMITTQVKQGKERKMSNHQWRLSAMIR